MEEKKFSGYFCKKCKTIPLIQIIPKTNNIDIFSSCKCKKQYQKIDSFIKNNYHKDIMDTSKISKESINNIYNDNNKSQKKNKNYIDSIIGKFNYIKEEIDKQGLELKNSLIQKYQRKIEELNEIYQKYKENNNKIILIFEQFIKSYQLIKDNPSNIENILINSSFNEQNKAKNLLNKSY